ncbi:MAG: exosortase/archaeosortase family protein [archaeon]
MSRKPFFSHPVIRTFVVRFFLVFFAVELLLFLFPPLGYQEWIATQIGNLLHVPVNETFLLVNESWFEISAFCSGFTTLALFAGLVLGFNIPDWATKVRFLMEGGLLIFLLNFIRIYFVVWVGVNYSFAAAETFHILSWFALSGMILWMWMELMKKETRTMNAGELARYLVGNQSR